MKAKKNQKQISIEEYIENYCQEKRIRKRFAVYVSPEMHHNLKSIARLFSNEHYTTTSSLADSIISRHFEMYRELLNNAYKEDTRKLFDWINKGNQEEKDLKFCQEEDEA